MARMNGQPGGAGGGPTLDQLRQQNMAARQFILANAINMVQPTYNRTFSSNIAGMVLDIPLRNVGMLKRLIIECVFTIARSAAETHTLTPWGPANCLSKIVLTDLSNQQRVNTAGWHLYALATARRQMAYGAAFTNDSPVNMGSNFAVISAPAQFDAGSQTVRMFYEVPVSYGDYDLRGAIYANVVNATFNIQLTVNQNFFCASTADPTLAVYQSSGADLGAISAVTFTIYQDYLDQIPQVNGGPVLPALDLSTSYLLQNTTISNLVANQDNPVPYPNYREFMSTVVIFDQAGTLNAGTDVAYWKLQVANYTNIFNKDPFAVQLQTRNLIGDDFPIGTYYFDHRDRPINTNQWGNVELVLNPSSVTVGAALLMGYEMLAIVNQVVQAGSLPGTGG